MKLLEPVVLAGRSAPSRVVFGPHPTNLGAGRSFSPRHVAYYRRRARAGAGIVVTETASVHPSDWPYERAPLATDCADGWRQVADACREHGTLVLAGLGHTGLQGSSAYSQSVLWAPSRFADAVSRELPVTMEQREIDALVAGFVSAARIAAEAGADGVEIDAGAGALLRQFHSGLTNHRSDDYGSDRLRLTTEVLIRVRRVLGADHILALRLSCDEVAPWAGVTAEMAREQVLALAPHLDLLTVVRGGPYSTTAYRPDAHADPGFNRELTGDIRTVLAGSVPVVLQGSIVDPVMAEAALTQGTADLVEMTRALIADAELVAKLRDDAADRIRPCILCNQTCQVRDNRNPIITCVGDPRSGHETIDPPPDGRDAASRSVVVTRSVVVIGGGPAGLETARVLSGRGHQVRLVERSDRLGGALRTAAVGPGRERLAGLTDWLESECRVGGVHIETGTTIEADELTALSAAGQLVLCTGSTAVDRRDVGPDVRDALSVLAAGADALPPGAIVIDDPVGGPVGVGIAEWLAALGRDVAIVAQDQVIGTQLARTGDLADANARLQRAGVTRHLRATLRRVTDGHAVLEDVWTGEQREVPCAVVIDCGHRLPEETLYVQHARTPRAGDAVAPRTVLEAILEGRRVALSVGAE